VDICRSFGNYRNDRFHFGAAFAVFVVLGLLNKFVLVGKILEKEEGELFKGALLLK
jgi:hypothetical protein